MLDWLKNINKEHPEFWKNYVSKFDKKNQSTRFYLNCECERRDFIHWFDNSIVNIEAVQYKFLHGLSNDFLVESKMKN
jgi:DNA polymerase-3 subunit epsilon